MLHIKIDTNKKVLSLFDDATLLKTFPVAVGKSYTPTPLGNWTIIKKGLWGEHFGGHFMQLSIPFGTYGIHGTDKPWSISQAVTNGCIRMYNNDAAELYNKVPLGTPVSIF